MTRYPTATLFLCLLVPVVVGTSITDPSQWPGLDDLPNCVKNIFGGCLNDCSNGGGCIPCYVGCADWTCACDQFSAAISAASSVAATACSTSQPDIASATSIVDGFCGQLLTTPTGPTAPTSVPTASSISTGDTSGRHAPTSVPIEALSLVGGGLNSVTAIVLIAVGVPFAAVVILYIFFTCFICRL